MPKKGMTFLLQGSDIFWGFFFAVLFLVSTQPTFHEDCGKGNLICSLQGELETVILAQAKQRRDFEETNAVDHADLYIQGHRKDGVYVIRPRQLCRPIQVFYITICFLAYNRIFNITAKDVFVHDHLFVCLFVC